MTTSLTVKQYSSVEAEENRTITEDAAFSEAFLRGLQNIIRMKLLLLVQVVPEMDLPTE